MSTADEITLMNTLNRTSILADTAACALVIIDGSKVVNDLDRTLGTNLLTLAAGDTSVETCLSYLSALVMAGALNNGLYSVWNKVNNVVGTGTGAKSAADTLLWIDLGNAALCDADGISWTNCNTVTVAEAGECAESITGEAHISSYTGLWSNVLVLLFFGLAGAVTSNVCNHLNNILCLNAHNGCYSFSNTVTTGGTEICLGGSALCESLCITVTAGESTGTTVGTGELFTNSGETLVFLNTEEDIRNSKKNCTKNCNYNQN